MRIRPTTAVFSSAALALGAGIMYIFDPSRGRGRRARLTDKLRSGAKSAGASVAATGKDVAHRTRGLVAETAGRMRGETVPDQVLVDRVRAELGHHTDRAHLVDVSASNGCVTLAGSVVADDVQELVDATRKVRGVSDVRNRMVIQERFAETATTATTPTDRPVAH